MVTGRGSCGVCSPACGDLRDDFARKGNGGRDCARRFCVEGLLQTLLVSLDHLLDHLAPDGACLAGGQVTVVAVGQVDTDFGSCLHLEAVHSLTGLRNVDLVVILAAHSNSLLCFLRTKILPEESIFCSVGIV